MIKAFQNELYKLKKIRKPPKLGPIVESEELFDIPDHWKWVRLGDVGDWGAGSTPNRRNPSYYEGDIPWLKTGELNDGYIDDSEEKVTQLALKETSLRLCQPGDVLMAMYGATIGKLGILQIEAATNQACCACTVFDGINNRYLFTYLRAQRDHFRSQGAGGAQPNISRTKIIETLFPLPPLAVQKRIVAKVDELFAQTRALKAELAQKEETRRKWRGAATARLSNAATNRERRDGWEHIATHFDTLYQTPDDIAALKQAILQLAVTGKLVAQDPGDEPAGVLLERIAAEKLRWGRDGLITRMRNPGPMTESDIPFALPHGWSVDRFANIADLDSGVTKGRKFGNNKTMMLPYLRVANVQRGYLDLNEIKTIEVKQGELEKYRLKAGDLLLTEGGDADKLGRSTIWQEEIPDCVHQNHIFRARAFLSKLRPEWFMLCTNSQYGREYFLGASKQTTNLASINMTQLSNFPMVLPPLTEQDRIILKLNELNAKIAAADRRIEEAHAARVRLRSIIM